MCLQKSQIDNNGVCRFQGFSGRDRNLVPCCIILVLYAISSKPVSMLVLQRRIFPFALRFQEEGKCIAATWKSDKGHLHIRETRDSAPAG